MIEEPLREGSIVVIEEKQTRARRLPLGALRIRQATLRWCNRVARRPIPKGHTLSIRQHCAPRTSQPAFALPSWCRAFVPLTPESAPG